MKAVPLTRLLAAATAACFIGHGLRAWGASATYYSEWSVWVRQALPFADYDGARYFLRVIGTIDIIVGLSFCRRAVPHWAFAWAVGWGLTTALSRLYFLGSLSGDPWVGLVHPLAETLRRTANWAVPLWLLHLSRRSVEAAQPPPPATRLIAVSVVTSLLLAYLVELFNPLYPYEVLKFGKPLWYFHFAGLLAGIGVASFCAAAIRRGRAAAYGTAFAVAGYAAVEGFDLVMRYLPHGATFTLTELAEHMPIYCALAVLALADGSVVQGKAALRTAA